MTTSFLNTGQLELARLRYTIAGEIACDWDNFVVSGALLTNLAHLPDPLAARYMETASRFEGAQGTAWAHSVGDRGDLHLLKEELTKVNRGRPQQYVPDQLAEFADRNKPKEAPAGRSAYGRSCPRRRFKSRNCSHSVQRAPKRRTCGRSPSSYATDRYRKRPPTKDVKGEDGETGRKFLAISVRND